MPGFKSLVSVNLSQFNDDHVDTPEPQDDDFGKYITDDGDLDIDSLIADYKEPDVPSVSQNEPGQEENPDQSTEKVEGDPESETTEAGEKGGNDQPEPPATETKDGKRPPDAAFAEMRRKAEQNEKFASWVQKLAEKQGFKDPEELISEFERQQLAKEAEAKGVPVDVYERLSQLEKDNKEKDDALFRDRFNMEVAKTQANYNLNEDQIREVFRFMGQNNYINTDGRATIPFEDAYILANKETLLKEAEERGRQSYLEEKQKKQQSAVPNAGTNAADSTSNSNSLDYSKEGIFKHLEKLGIEID